MAKIFRSIERELITYMYLKKRQLYSTYPAGVFQGEDELSLNNNLKLILRVEIQFGLNTGILSEHWLSIHPRTLLSDKRFQLHDILILKILLNKINTVYLCDYNKYNDYEFDVDKLSNRNKQDLEDLIMYLGMILGMGYPEIKEFEKKLKLYNVSMI